MKQLTKNQSSLLEYLCECRLIHGSAPTLREMVKKIGVSDNKSILGILDALESKGYITREKRKSRSVLLTKDAWSLTNNLNFRLYKRQPTAADQLRQPTEMGRDTVTVSFPTSDFLRYSDKSIKTDGTQIDGGFQAIVETAVSMAVDRCFNGTSNHKSRQMIAKSITGILSKLFQQTEFTNNFGWAILFTGLTWACIALIGKNLTALGFSVTMVLIIKKFLNGSS